jgi:hypothetical protein
MKKVLATILAVIYLSTSMGATIHLHYCMGKLFSWSLTGNDSKNCEKCGMSKRNTGGHGGIVNNGCCKDKLTQVQLDQNQKTTENNYTLSDPSLIAIPVTTAAFSDLYVVSSILGYPTANAPPEPDKVPVFIRHCAFRI